jgi:hypothetical protein
MQLDFLEEVSEYKHYSSQVKELIDMTHKLRKSFFAQMNDHDKILVKLQDQIDYLHQRQAEIQLVQIK